MSSELKLFSTCPESRTTHSAAYRHHVAEAARWSEAAGFEGTLIYTENGLVDPWLVAQLVIEATDRLLPLVAVQPVYMHPYSVAKMVATFAHLYGRRTYLNMVAGGFRNDLAALGDELAHDTRYERLIEYTSIIKQLTGSSKPVTFTGSFYTTAELPLTPVVPPDCGPAFMISGSSAAGVNAARQLGAIAVKYPQPASQEQAVDAGAESGMRIGIVARQDREDAWRTAYMRFPEDRAGQIAHHLAMQVSDSEWHDQLSALAYEAATEGNPYWLGPFKNYKTFCPYLVGSYDDVAQRLADYLQRGFRYFILDVPASEEELHHIGTAFRDAVSISAR